MKIRTILILALLPALCTAMVHADMLHVGDKMEFAFTSITGQQVSMKALAGKIVIVEMWATWCDPAMDEVEHMLKINQEQGPNGVQIIGISVDYDKNALVRTLTSQQMTWPEYFDGLGGNNAFAKQWNVHGFPHCYLVGPDGTILWIGHPARLDEPLADALKNHPPVLVDPDVLKAQNQLLDQVNAAIMENDTSKAMKLLTRIRPEASKDHTFAARLDGIQQQLQDAAKQALADVDALLDQKQYVEAAQKLEDLSHALAGTSVARDVKVKLDAVLKNPEAKAAIDKTKTEAAAIAALATAQKLADAKSDLEAYQAMKQIVAHYPGTAQAATAAAAVAKYEKDPNLVHRANSNQDTAKAKAMLGLAGSFRDSGEIDKAKAKYQQVIDQFKGSDEAVQAQKALNEMGN